jgi:hypothetical protein
MGQENILAHLLYRFVFTFTVFELETNSVITSVVINEPFSNSVV